MERRNQSPSIIRQYLLEQMFCGGDSSINANNGMEELSTVTQNPPLSIPNNLPDRWSLESAFARLVLSSSPTHHSLFYSPPHPSIVAESNPAVTDPLIGQGFAYHHHHHQLQQTNMELQRLRLQEALSSALMRSPPESYNPISYFGEEQNCREEFFNRASINCCGKSCCRFRPRQSSGGGEYTNKGLGFPTMPCSNNGNGFSLDSTNGQILETENPYKTLRSLWLEDLRGQMVVAAKDQHGCRFLQNKLEEGRLEEIEMVFAELIDKVGELMIHPFGNYVVQKLSETCTEEQKMKILKNITHKEYQLITICLDMHGTRAVQKLLEHLNTQEQISCVMLALRPGIVRLIKDVNGHHVIEHCMKHFSNEDNKYLLNAVADHCVEIAKDSSGCCVMQNCLEHAKGGPRERLFAEITANALFLAQHPYGNYVVQYILGLKIPHVMAAVLRQLEGSYIHLSLQKFSSHVVEKCLKESEEEQSTRIVKELLSSTEFLMLLKHAYGNYVVQSALLVSKGAIYKAIVDLVQSIPSMRNNPYGKRILDRINAKR